MEDVLAINFSKNFSCFIESRGLTHGDKKPLIMAVAELIGKSESHVHNIFVGRKTPNETERRAICRYFGLNYNKMAEISYTGSVIDIKEQSAQRLIDEFNDVDRALKIREMLRDLEHQDPHGYDLVEMYLTGRHSQLRDRKKKPKKKVNNPDP